MTAAGSACGARSVTPGEKQAVSRSVKHGGDQIEYEDQDPQIHQIWLEEMRKAGITPMLDATALNIPH